MVGTGRFFRDSSRQRPLRTRLGYRVTRGSSGAVNVNKRIRRVRTTTFLCSFHNHYVRGLQGSHPSETGIPERRTTCNSRHYSPVETSLAPRRPRHPPHLWTNKSCAKKPEQAECLHSLSELSPGWFTPILYPAAPLADRRTSQPSRWTEVCRLLSKFFEIKQRNRACLRSLSELSLASPDQARRRPFFDDVGHLHAHRR